MMRIAALGRRTSAALRPRALSTWDASDWPQVAIPKTDLTSYITRNWAEYGDKAAIIDGVTGEEASYADLLGRIGGAAAALQARGFGKGDTLLVHAPNSIDYAVAFQAAACLGGVTSTSNPLYTPRELSHQLVDSEACLVLTDAALAGVVDGAIDAAEPALGSRASVVTVQDPGVFTKAAQHAMPTGIDVDPESLCVLPYSSGTTGLPKGVMLSHRNLVSNLCQINQHPELSIGAAPDDVSLAILPFFHIYGMVAIQMASLDVGGTLVTLPKFEPESFLTTAMKYKCTFLGLVPPIILFLAKHPVVDKFDLSAVRGIFSGAAPLDAETQMAVAERLSCDVRQGYGMTELSPVSHINAPNHQRPGSVGLTVASAESRIVDKEGTVLATTGPENTGEIQVRGPQVMMGYLNKPDDDTVSADGWLSTGDVGYCDADGFYFVVDRVKELIKVKGFQVAPAELEGILLGHPDVADAAVIPVPDERTGEAPRAYVVLKEGKAEDEASIKAFVAATVAEYKQLKDVVFIDVIPKSASGKILRRVLKDSL